MWPGKLPLPAAFPLQDLHARISDDALTSQTWCMGSWSWKGLFGSLPSRSIPLRKKARPSAFLFLLKHSSASQNKHSWLLSHLPSLFLCLLISCGHLYPHHGSGMGLLIHIILCFAARRVWTPKEESKLCQTIPIWQFSELYLEQSRRNKHFVGVGWDI